LQSNQKLRQYRQGLVNICKTLYIGQSENFVKTKEMKNGKILTLGIAILAFALLSWVFTQAFHLLSAPSDVSVIGGIILLCISFLASVKLFSYLLKNYLK